MVAPVLETDWTVNDSGGSTTDGITLTKPAGVSNGELLIMICGCDFASNSSWWDTYTGWTREIETGDTNSDCHMAVYTRVADGTEGATERPTSIATRNDQETYGWYMRVTGDDGSPLHVVGGENNHSPTTSFDLASITTTVDDCLNFYCFAFDGGDGIPFSVSGGNGTGFVEIDEHGSGTGSNDACGCFGTQVLASFGATGIATVTSSSSDGGTGTQFAVAPSTGVVTQNVVATAAAIASRSVTVFHNVRATAAGSATVAKLVLLIRQATAAGVATVNRVKLALRQAFATAAGIASRSVTVFHNVPGTAAGVAVKGPWTIFHNVRATAAAIGTSIEQKIGGLIQRSVNATAAAVATVQRTTFISDTAIAAAVATVRRTVFQTVEATAAAVASRALTVFHGVSATVSGLASVQRTVFHFLSAAAAGVATRTLLILKLVQGTVAGVGAVVSSLNPGALVLKSVSAVADVVASVTARVITSVKPFVGSGGLGISKVSSWRRRQATWRPKR